MNTPLHWKGHTLTAVLEHAAADRLLAAAGWQIPAIPAGCNTVEFPFTTADGRRALAVNQRGFAPRASDNEEEVNGCLVLILHETLGRPDLDDAVLRGFLRERETA